MPTNSRVATPFSVFFPVYNEEALMVPNVEKVLRYLERWAGDFEIVIGSNGSTDSTPGLGRALAEREARVRFFHLEARGAGGAFAEAVRRMRTSRLICMDMDLSVDLEFIRQAVEGLEQNDIVIGSKKLGQETRSWLRRSASDLYIFLAQSLLDLPFDDYSLGAKGFRREILERYPSAIGGGSFYVQRLIYLAFHDQRPIQSIPVSCQDLRPSRFNLLHEGIYRFGSLFGLWLRGFQSGQRCRK